MSIREYLPSKEFRKKFFAVIGIAIIFFGVTELIGYIKNRKNGGTLVKEGVLGKDYVNVPVGDVIEVDTDKDGIRDFEEILYGTDPDVAETTPGIPDRQIAEEIRAKAAEAGTGENININETSQFAGEFLSSIIALDRAGLVNDQNKEVLSDSFFEYIKNYPDENIYTEESFKTFAKNDIALDSAYVKTMIPIIKANLLANDDSLTLTGLLLKNGETKQIKRFDEIQKKYEDAEKKLTSVSVPLKNIESHTMLTNAIHKLALYVKNMKDVVEDPLPGFVALIRYQNVIILYEKGYNDTVTFLKQYIR